MDSQNGWKGVKMVAVGNVFFLHLSPLRNLHLRKYPIRYNISNLLFEIPNWWYLTNWGLVMCSPNLLFQTHISPIPNWVYHFQLEILYPKLGIIFPIGNICCLFSNVAGAILQTFSLVINGYCSSSRVTTKFA